MTSILRTAGTQARTFLIYLSWQFNENQYQCRKCISKNKSLSMEKTN